MVRRGVSYSEHCGNVHIKAGWRLPLTAARSSGLHKIMRSILVLVGFANA